MKRRICILLPDAGGTGGVPAVAHFLYQVALNSDEFEVKVASLALSSADENSILFSDLRTWARGIKCAEQVNHNWQFTAFGAWFAEFELFRYFGSRVLTDYLNQFDLVQLVCGTPAWGHALSKVRTPCIMQVATTISAERGTEIRNGLAPKSLLKAMQTWILVRFLDLSGVKSVDVVFTENPGMTKTIKEYKEYAGELVLHPPGVDVDLYFPLADRSPEVKYILFSGRASDARKNLGMMIDVLKYLKCTLNLKVVLKVMTPQMCSDDFLARATECDVISQIEFCVDLSPDERVTIFQNAGVFVVPSLEEGLGMALLEAMSCGIPAVSTRCGGPDYILEEGAYGRLVEVGDTVGMARAIAEICRDNELAMSMGQKSRERVVANFNSSRAGEAFLKRWQAN